MMLASFRGRSRPYLRSLGRVFAGPAVAGVALWMAGVAGCAIVVVDSEGADGAGGSGGGGSSTTTTESTCTSTAAPKPPNEVVVTAATSAVFVDGFLHLEAVADGEPSYLVLAVDGPGVAHVVAAPKELLGPANLVEIAKGTHARVRPGPSWTIVDVIDTTVPEAPALLAQKEVSGEAGSVFAAAEQHLFFCDLLPGFEEKSLIAVDLGAPAEPGVPVGFESKMCNRFPGGGMAANGPTWLVWGAESDLNLYSVGASGEKQIGDYLYNPDGVHSYGPVLAGSNDATRAALDPGNDSEMFLFDLLGAQPLTVTHEYFGLEGPKHMLGVVDAVVYVATASQVRAYDVSDLSHLPNSDKGKAVLLPYQADVDFGSGDVRLLAASADHLAIAGGGGALFLVPRSSPGKVSAAKVYDAPPPPAPCAP